MKWLRLYSSVLHDPKVQRLSPALFKHWINLLCLANESEPRGILPSVDDIAFALRIKPSESGAILAQLRRAGLVDQTREGRDFPHNWPQRQRESDDVAARVDAFRRRKAAQEAPTRDNGNMDVTLPVTLHVRESNTPDTDTDTDTEKQTDAYASGDATKRVTAAAESPSPDPEPVKATKAPKREPRFSREEQAYVAEVITAYKARLHVKRLSAEGKERAAAHWFYRAGPTDGEPVPIETVLHVYDLLKARPFWRGKLLSLAKVAEQFPEWTRDPHTFAADGMHGGGHGALAIVTQAQDEAPPDVEPPPEEPPAPAPPAVPRRMFHLAGYTEAPRVWRAIADELRKPMSRQQFDTLFGGVKLFLPPKHATAPPDPVAVPTLVFTSAFTADLIRERFADRIEQACRQVAPQISSLRLVCASEVDLSERLTAPATAPPDEPPDAAGQPPPVIALSAHRPRSPTSDDDTPKGA